MGHELHCATCKSTAFWFTSHEGTDPGDSSTGNWPEVAVNNASTGTGM